MKPYLIQSFKNDLGETDRARMIAPEREADRVLPVSGTEVTLLPEAGAVYECGAVTALTLSGLPGNGAFAVVFTSGAEATVLTVPTDLVMPENFTVEANTRYEISVRDGYALCAGWAVSGS